MPNATPDYGYTLPADRKAENEIVYQTDAAGFVTRVLVVSADCDRLTGAHRALAEAAQAVARPAYEALHGLPNPPLDPADIVWPAGWPVDADGRLYSVLEVQRHHHLTHHSEEIAA